MIHQMDCTALLAAFGSGETSPSDAVALVLARIKALEPQLNAYSTLSSLLERQALAASARWAKGTPLGPLDGVPLCIKDNLVSAGLPASWGNGVLARRVSLHDEVPVARLRAAGALVVGKGNTPEFAVEGFTDNLTFGVTRNPFDPALTPGGSSGGVVAALAAGMAFAGLATDGGGSIRRPAGYTGLLGLKPGIGHVARGGGLAQVLLDFECVGPIARSLRDLRLLDRILSGQSARAGASRAARILAVPTLGNAPCDDSILAAFGGVREALVAQGHRVEVGAFPHDLAALNAGWSSIGAVGLAAYFRQEPEVATAAAPKYRDMAVRGEALGAADFYAILNAVHDLRQAAQGLWGFDAILMPSSAAPPWPAAESHPTRIAGQDVGPRGHAVYTGWVNAAGLPALAFPATVTQGVPIGMQLVGRMGSESALMDIVEPILTPFRWPDRVPAAS